MAAETEKSNSDLLAQAGRKADKRLREAHTDQWNAYKQEEAKALGLDWTPPLSKEAKAEQQLQALLAEHPHLADKISQGTLVG